MSERNTPVDSIADCFSREQLDAFCTIVKVPDFMIPWLSRFFEPREIEFVLELNQQRSTDMDARSFSEWIQKNEPNWPDEAIEMQHNAEVGLFTKPSTSNVQFDTGRN